ncbi:50S ribosomal protein L25 [Candidatus Omnitrophota bacterium]
MEKIALKADTREKTGKEINKKLRAQGIVPAVVYKKGKSALPLQVNARELFHVLHTSAGENVVVTLKIHSSGSDSKSEKSKTVIVKETQHDPIKGDVLHIDFHEISLTEKIIVSVPVEAKGEPEGVKVDGGVLDHPVKDIQIECLPTQIPEQIEVHVEALKIGDSIRVKDLPVPAEVKILSDPEITVLSVAPPHVEKEEPEEVEEETSEPEVIREKKDEGEAAPEAEAPKKEDKKKE